MTQLQYINELKRHDWGFQWSDDNRVWRRGRDALDKLSRYQREHDKDGALWNEHAPADYKIKPTTGATQ